MIREHRTYFLAFTVRYPNLREIYFYKQQISDELISDNNTFLAVSPADLII